MDKVEDLDNRELLSLYDQHVQVNHYDPTGEEDLLLEYEYGQLHDEILKRMDN